MQRLTIDNNVRVTLNTGINNTATSIILDNAVAPFRNPPAPVGGAPGLVTLVDSLSNPTKIEIVTYTGVSGNTLTGCLRGRDGTTAQSWSAGANVICAPTRSLVDPANVALLDQANLFTVTPQVPQLVAAVPIANARVVIPSGEERVITIRTSAFVKIALTNLPSTGDTFHDVGLDFGAGEHDVVDVTFAFRAIGSGSGAAVVRFSDLPTGFFDSPVNHGDTRVAAIRFIGAVAGVILGVTTLAGNPFGISA